MFNYDYVVSKIHAIHSKSFLGENFKKLTKISSIERLHKELFPKDNEIVLTKKLYTRIEKLFKEKTYKEINNIAKFFNYRNKFINNIILKYEIDNLKIIVKTYLSGLSKISDLFEIKLDKTLDYQLIYDSDMSDIKNVQKVLKKTVFKFILPMLEEKKPDYIIENALDKFYYRNFIDSLNELQNEEKQKIYLILKEEMNWQNILWAFRVKLYYGKSFKELEDTFLNEKGLISLELIKNISDLQFIPGEPNRVFRDFPKNYSDIILKSFTEDGDVDLPLLEKRAITRLSEHYLKYFYIGEEILPIISFIYIKQNEYNNIVKLVESLRYNLPIEN
ncbi:MAG: hypothetical protein A2086_06635 [Spirochaetes bacterium GWD1_27_9]|nr:MAG: hypothetical protein A2Z98_00490 [Spirochaetes bacterium GWB1_27_13]OHD20045.1 MAG: hypothetical protein A2Y34_08045 [Spirochaetes bacterium GWC1_27_15]OHD41315.1 MAG: hypothetical protein A2086_06635 [Spirochaetes bacterium GWD1_27_9]